MKGEYASSTPRKHKMSPSIDAAVTLTMTIMTVKMEIMRTSRITTYDLCNTVGVAGIINANTVGS